MVGPSFIGGLETRLAPPRAPATALPSPRRREALRCPAMTSGRNHDIMNNKTKERPVNGETWITIDHGRHEVLVHFPEDKADVNDYADSIFRGWLIAGKPNNALIVRKKEVSE